MTRKGWKDRKICKCWKLNQKQNSWKNSASQVHLWKEKAVNISKKKSFHRTLNWELGGTLWTSYSLKRALWFIVCCRMYGYREVRKQLKICLQQFCSVADRDPAVYFWQPPYTPTAFLTVEDHGNFDIICKLTSEHVNIYIQVIYVNQKHQRSL